MEQGNHYPNSQRGYGHAQNENHPQPPQAGVSWNNSYHTAYANTPTTGYVHSGYQAAIHGSAAKATTSQQNTWSHPTARPTPISNSHGSLGTSRPPRYGPGGPVRCSYPDCPYSGYTKDVEIHRMDRHLIFPPGYKHKNGPPDGEIGPSRAIPGTGIVLNTPEAIEAWIAERKKKWPTEAKIAENQKRKAEAVERGELDPVRSKRPRPDAEPSFINTRGRGRGRGFQRGRGRGRGNFLRTNQPEENKHIQTVEPRTASLPAKPLQLASDESTDDDPGSGSDIDLERDLVSSKVPQPDEQIDEHHSEESSEHEMIVAKTPKKRPPKQPPKRPYNPLVDRPSFLRKLLQSEIRHTVSNLSQAIRFIVDNDFFRGVELMPGEAEKPLILELDSQPTASAVHNDHSDETLIQD